MSFTTCGDLITLALKTAGVVGVGQTAAAEDANDALIVLRNMVALWRRDRFLAWDLVEAAVISTGALSYTLTDRPVRIESAFARLIGNGGSGLIDYPLEVIASREAYNAISLKTLATFPAAVFLDTGYPVATAYFYPVPPAGMFELHLAYHRALPDYAALTDLLALPPEYNEAALYGLAGKLAPLYGREPMRAHVALYKGALSAIRASNAQMRPARISAPGCGANYGMGAGISGAVNPAQSIFQLGNPTSVLG